MRKLIAGVFVVAIFTVVGLAQANTPTLKQYVNDFAGKLTTNQRIQLEQRLREYDQQTTVQFVIVIPATLQGKGIEDYAKVVFRANEVGQREANNGLLLVWAPSERKYFLATGRGMEGVLPDGKLGELLRINLVPSLKADKPYEGLSKTVEAVITVVDADRIKQLQYTHQQSQVPAVSVTPRVLQSGPGIDWLWVFGVILTAGLAIGGVVLLVILGRAVVRFFARRKLTKELLTVTIPQQRQALIDSYTDFTLAAENVQNELPIQADKLAIDGLKDQAQSLYQTIDNRLVDLAELATSDPMKARTLCEQQSGLDLSDVTAQVNAVAQSYRAAVKEAPHVVSAATELFTDRSNYYADLKAQGYIFTNPLKKSSELQDNMLAAFDFDNPNPRQAVFYAKELCTELNTVYQNTQELFVVRYETNQLLSKIEKEIKQLETTFAKSLPRTITKLQKYPQSVWRNCIDSWELIDAEARIIELREEVSKIRSHNDKHIEQYLVLQSQARDLHENVQNFAVELNEPEALLKRLEDLQAKMAGKRVAVMTAFNQVDITGDGVKSQVQETFNALKEEFEAYNKSVTGNYCDWIAVSERYGLFEKQIEAISDAVRIQKKEARNRKSSSSRGRSSGGSKSSTSYGSGNDDSYSSSWSYGSGSSSSSDSSSLSSSSDSFSGGGGSYSGGGAGGDY